jgi:hypothetical protein
MDCPAFLEWSRTLSQAKLELARVKASRPKVRGTSSRFESELEKAEFEVSWTASWVKDHIEKCEVCKANGVRADSAF